ncbi:MAG: hypothetical protein D6729_16410 [Deltaproteobacteria bacterium]|nr:MAG: hypothetical protein D6729_16410 [Deltaproteobacteria bacterium]
MNRGPIVPALDPPASGEQAPALFAGGEPLSRSGLVARVETCRRAHGADDPARPIPIVAEATSDTVVEILAALEDGPPRLLLHPRWSEAERAAVTRRATAAPVPPDEAIALLVPTSGSSGRPRAAKLSRAALRAAIAASAAHLGTMPDDVWLCPLPLAHLGGLMIPLRAVAAGRPVAFLERRGGEAFAPAFIDAVGRHRVTLTSLVPALLHRLLDEAPRWRPPGHLRAVLVGGAAATPERLRAAWARGLPVLATYGLTETCGQVVTETPGTPPAKDGSVGRALPGVEVRVGSGGRIEVRSPTIFSGYHPPPGDGGGCRRLPDGFLRTTDLGRVGPDGRLVVLGRADGVIVTGGEKVHPEAVEAALLTHPAVRDAGVVGLSDTTFGQVVAAGVVLERGATTLAAIEAHARRRLGQAARPRVLRALPALPRTPTHKLDRRALAALLRGARGEDEGV